MTLLLLFLPPILVSVTLFFLSKGRVNWKELLVQAGVAVLLIGSGFALGRCGVMADREVWNGRIAEKHEGTESCCHDYPCNCREECSGSGSSRSCSTVCDTCYEHIQDDYWSASTTNGERVFYDGCNPPGSSPPSRWNAIVVGEPTAVEHRFKNYIKGAPGTILKKQGLVEKYKGLIPQYPRTYDLYRIRRVLPAGVEVPGAARMDAVLDEINARLGRPKQVNMIVVVTAAADRGYIHALEEAWLGGKKNDLVLVVGAPDYPKIAWAGVMSWTKVENLKLSLRDAVEDMGTFDGDRVMALLEREVSEKFIRRPMADFEYLSSSIQPPFWLLVVLLVLGLGVSGGLGYWFWKEDPLG